MKKLFLLHNRLSDYCLLLERIAKEAGWDTWRGISSDDYYNICKPYDTVRYYGNYIHATWVEKQLVPFKFDHSPSFIIDKVDKHFLGREVFQKVFSDVKQPLTERTFVKCAFMKRFDPVIIEAGGSIPDIEDKTEMIYLQKPINGIECEVRCFVLNGKILTASYYLRHNNLYDKNIDDSLPDMLKHRVELICDKLNITNGIVMDFWKPYNSDEWFFLEANEPAFSGFYDCDPKKVFAVLINSQFDIK